MTTNTVRPTIYPSLKMIETLIVPENASPFTRLAHDLYSRDNKPEDVTSLLVEIANVYVTICETQPHSNPLRQSAQDWIWDLFIEFGAHADKVFARHLISMLETAEYYATAEAVVEIIGKVRCRLCARALVKFLHPGSHAFCWRVVWALGELRSGHATTALMHMYWHKRITTRGQRHMIADALVNIGDMRAISLINWLVTYDGYKLPASKRTPNRAYFDLRPPLT